MKIFGIEFGEKKNHTKKIEEKVEEKIDLNKSLNQSDDIIKECTVTYYPKYQNLVDQIKNEGWNYLGDVNSVSSNIVRTYFLGKGMYGTFLELTCPSTYYKVTICGLDDAGIEPQNFYKHSNLYNIPHFFSITCKDDNGKEISPNITIDIVKITSNIHKKLFSEYYGDLSQHIDGKFRRKEERYYFPTSIELEDDDRLSFRTSPDIDIVTTTLFMKGDVFAKDIDKI